MPCEHRSECVREGWSVREGFSYDEEQAHDELEKKKLTDLNGIFRFGHAVSIDGTMVVVGGALGGSGGRATIFEFCENADQQQSINQCSQQHDDIRTYMM